MKKITEEVTQKKLVTKYMANDRSVFNNMDDCARYEESFELTGRYNNLVAGSISECDMIGCGGDDCAVDIVRMATEEDADVVKAMWTSNNISGKSDREFASIDRALKENDILFISRGCCDDEFYIYGSAAEIIEHFANYRKIEKEKDKN